MGETERSLRGETGLGRQAGPGGRTHPYQRKEGDEAKLGKAAGWGFKKREPAEKSLYKAAAEIGTGRLKKRVPGKESKTGEGIPRGRAEAAGAV